MAVDLPLSGDSAMSRDNRITENSIRRRLERVIREHIDEIVEVNE